MPPSDGRGRDGARRAGAQPELQQVNHEIAAGVPRADALKRLDTRTGLNDGFRSASSSRPTVSEPASPRHSEFMQSSSVRSACWPPRSKRRRSRRSSRS